jgi:hypothetical protein
VSGHVLCVKGINLPLSTILIFDCSFFSFFFSSLMSSDTIVLIDFPEYYAFHSPTVQYTLYGVQ